MAAAIDEGKSFEDQQKAKLEAIAGTTEKALGKGVEGDILAKHTGDYAYYVIGGDGGTEFQDEKYDQGLAVSGIEAWADTWTLHGIRIKFSDNSVVVRGQMAGTYCGGITIDYAGGETVTGLSIWGNGIGTRCGAFRIQTSKGQDFFPKMTKWGLKTEYKMNPGGGVILGVLGQAAWDIDCLGFVMLAKVEKSLLTELEYDLNKISSPDKKYAYDVTIPNPSSTDSHQGAIQKITRIEKAGEWFVKGGLTFGQSFSVKAEVPGLVEAEASSSWQVSVETGYNQRWSNTAEQTVTIPLICPAYTMTRIAYSYFQGTVDGCPFSATMKYYTAAGGVWNCRVTGFYDGVDTTRVIGKSYLVAKWNTNTNQWIPV
ncbi:hypothetical protein [Microcystis sp. LEGE 08355]|jgi:hypothetical protein|uniref:jacalin-like lectin n=1 Tax=Microcystis sp. LEGE 08355 TaxID=1828687 RepID=UPI00188214BB|nr:hypothetical protein [Microcystis sp. LEGE 08355]MBE9075196.1 hypothetical protein [Microcystis sp. LEGE 08355]